MSSKTIIALLFVVLFSIIIGDMEAYRLDNDETRTDDIDENNELKDPYFIQRLQALLAAVGAANVENGNKNSVPFDRIINTRLATNRRPGLLRLKKSD
jgi:hypothetical protein